MAYFKLVLVVSTAAGLFFWRRFVGGKCCRSKRKLTGKVVIITGANSGIGKATACELAKADALVILACRNVKKGMKAATEIRRQTKMGELVVKKLDLASFDSVRTFVKEITAEIGSVDILVNNAGVFQCPFMLTEDGLEYQMGVNHFGHFLLTILLIPIFKKTSHSRIVIVSSILMKRGEINISNLGKLKDAEGYDKRLAYTNSKLANALFSQELSTQVPDISVFCVSPGMVLSSLGRYSTPPLLSFLLWPLARLLLKTPVQGCQTILHCCLAEELDGQTGHFYRNCNQTPWPRTAQNKQLARELWGKSLQIVGVKYM